METELRLLQHGTDCPGCGGPGALVVAGERWCRACGLYFVVRYGGHVRQMAALPPEKIEDPEPVDW